MSFNPRPRAGGDGAAELGDVESVVSIHAPARGATQRAPCAGTHSGGFQSTPPRGGRLRRSCRRYWLPSCFNPRPRAGGDLLLFAGQCHLDVSIHAPARGATVCGGVSRASSSSFNPRPRAGGDPIAVYHRNAIPLFQSTPPRGGRLVQFLREPDQHCFNPRPRAGGDAVLIGCHSPLMRFQSTPPRGGRRALLGQSSSKK